MCYAEKSGFTCDTCSKKRRAIRAAATRSDLRQARSDLKNHLDLMFDGRKELAQHKFKAVSDDGYTLIMADAADQAKLGCPLIKSGGRAGGSVKKIKQQFIGVLIHGVGYYIYRRLPVSLLPFIASV